MENLEKEYFSYWDLYGKGHPHTLFFENDIINNIYFFFLILLGFFLINIFFKKSNLTRINFLYCYHLIFTGLFILYVSTNVNDADTFYRYAYFPYFFTEEIKLFRIGSSTIANIISIFNNFLNLSFLNWNIIFGFFGFIGIVLIDITLQKIIENKSKLIKIIFSLLILSPSLHFYTAGVGKEALSIFSIGLLIFGIKFNKKYLIPIALIIMFFTRIHVFVVMLFSYAINLFFNSNLSLKLKILTSLLSSIIFLIIASKIITGSFFSMEVFNKFYSFSEVQRGYLKDFRTWFDTTDFNSVKLMIYILFYPLSIFKISNYIDYVVVIENYVLLFLILTIFFKLYNARKTILEIKNIIFYSLFSFLMIFLLSHFISVYGIILRQKWIYITILLIFLAELLSLKKYK